MCEWGNSVLMEVLVPARLSHTGRNRLAVKGIDRCIAPLIKHLNESGITTIQSCCGHGNGHGSVTLSDGRDVDIAEAWQLLGRKVP